MSLGEAYGYGTGVILGSVFFVILQLHHLTLFEVVHMNLKIRVACSTLVYRKVSLMVIESL